MRVRVKPNDVGTVHSLYCRPVEMSSSWLFVEVSKIFIWKDCVGLVDFGFRMLDRTNVIVDADEAT